MNEQSELMRSIEKLDDNMVSWDFSLHSVIENRKILLHIYRLAKANEAALENAIQENTANYERAELAEAELRRYRDGVACADELPKVNDDLESDAVLALVLSGAIEHAYIKLVHGRKYWVVVDDDYKECFISVGDREAPTRWWPLPGGGE